MHLFWQPNGNQIASKYNPKCLQSTKDRRTWKGFGLEVLSLSRVRICPPIALALKMPQIRDHEPYPGISMALLLFDSIFTSVAFSTGVPSSSITRHSFAGNSANGGVPDNSAGRTVSGTHIHFPRTSISICLCAADVGDAGESSGRHGDRGSRTNFCSCSL
jgi:hypothetical protein